MTDNVRRVCCQSRRVAIFSPLASGLFLLAACGGTPPVQPGYAVTTPAPELGQDIYAASLAAEYTLRPADVLRITVFREEDLSLEQIPVSATGEISLPLVGSITVTGLTPLALETRIEELLGARYLRDPDVTVNVLQYASHTVTVEGEVENPGIYSFQPGTRLSGAVALAQGPGRVAATSQVAVFRQTPEGMAVAKFDYNAVQQGTMLDPVLVPGDRVVMGTSGLSQFWQDFLRSIPVFALFTRL